MGNLEWLAFAAALPACLEPRGDGFKASMGPVCTFPSCKGRRWGSARNRRVVTSPVLLGSLGGKCEEQLCSRLAQRTSNCGNWTTWQQMAASWKRTRLGKQQVAICSSNTAVKDLARCSSDMHDRAVRAPTRTPRGRAYTSVYWRRAARWLLIEHVMIEPSAGARGRRAGISYCRTAVDGFETANRDNVFVCESEMCSEGVANRPNGQRFWDQQTSLYLLHQPTVLQRPC
jgi:hypothetical protein